MITISETTFAQSPSPILEISPSPTPTAQPTKVEAPTNIQKAFVIATNAIITREPTAESAVVVQLRRGEALDVLDIKGDYTQVRYKIEDEFPVSGWVPTAVLSKPAKSVPRITDLGQAYVPENKTAVNTQVNDFPTPTMNERVIVPKGTSQHLKIEPKKEAPPLPPPVSHHKAFGWSNELAVQLGIQSWQESLKTKQSSGEYFSGSFLSYELSGASIEINDTIAYKLHDMPLTTGAHLLYRFTFFSDSVDSSNANIAKSSIQSQFHEIEVTPFARWSYKVAPQWSLEPELGPTLGAHIFVTNQLQDIPTSSSVSRSGQAVLFGITAFYSKLDFKPTVRGPFNLRLSPDVAMLLLYSFSEYPSSSDPADVRTGDPSGANMSLSYGFELGWGLNQFRGPNSEFVFNFQIQNLARNYSGAGNRAGTQTLDATASSTTTLYSLGYRYLF